MCLKGIAENTKGIRGLPSHLSPWNGMGEEIWNKKPANVCCKLENPVFWFEQSSTVITLAHQVLKISKGSLRSLKILLHFAYSLSKQKTWIWQLLLIPPRSCTKEIFWFLMPDMIIWPIGGFKIDNVENSLLRILIDIHRLLSEYQACSQAKGVTKPTTDATDMHCSLWSKDYWNTQYFWVRLNTSFKHDFFLCTPSRMIISTPHGITTTAADFIKIPERILNER